MTDKPRIGITIYGRDDEDDYRLPCRYVESVRRAGAIPLLIPPGGFDFDTILPILDGVVFSGGGDLEPKHYGRDDHETLYEVSPERDEFELAFARRILIERLPTLGICRGTQVLNVVAGGTLHVHLPERFGEAVLHRAPPREPIAHDIRVEHGSRLAEAMGAVEFSAASSHHQGIDRVGDGFDVVARAPDGVVEGLEKPDHPWFFCVQWHPEITAAQDPIQQRIFDRLAEAAGSRRER